MEQKVDYRCNLWLGESLVAESAKTGIIRTIVPQFENNGVDDIWFSAMTLANTLVSGPLENKCIKKMRELKGDDGNWRDWYNSSNPNGIMHWLKGDIPPDKNIYFLNAEDKSGDPYNCKWYKMHVSAASLCFMAVDGYIIFSPKTLDSAFLGYADFYNRYHTEEINKTFDPRWEKKAIIDLDKGLYIRSHGPLEMYQ